MLDCGIHPGFSGMNALPFFDEIDLDTVDVMLVTHFHLDHCAAVPYVVGKTNFKARPWRSHLTQRQAAVSKACGGALYGALAQRLQRLVTCVLKLVCESAARQQQRACGVGVPDPWHLHNRLLRVDLIIGCACMQC